MLAYNLDKLFKLRGVNKRMAYLRQHGFSRATANTLAYRPQNMMKISVIERLCKTFQCTPNDLMEWTPDTPEEDKPENPMNALKKEEIMPLRDLTYNMPLSKIKEIAREVRQRTIKN